MALKIPLNALDTAAMAVELKSILASSTLPPYTIHTIEKHLNKIEEAKNTLKKAGYYTDKLWSVSDVKTKFQCTDIDAQKLLEKALNNDATMEQVWFSIQEFGELMNLETKKQ